MPLYRFAVQRISRAAGRSAPAAAAYRAGERIRDERTGVLHNYARRQDVTHREILLPSTVPPGAAGWALDRARLWNVAEAAELRRNSLVAREYQLALPHELDPARRLQLARTFAVELADRHGIAVDLALHDPRPDGDPRNFHAHLLVTTREVREGGLGAKAGMDLSHAGSEAKGLLGRGELAHLRQRWAERMNEAYRDANLDLRVDARSLAAQGIDRTPVHRSFVAIQIERRQLRRERLERLAEAYGQRTDRHRDNADADIRPGTGHEAIEAARRAGIEAWQAMRQGPSTGPQAAEQEMNAAQIDNDHGL